MVRHHLRHFNRGLIMGFEVLGVGLLFLAAAWLGLMIRLAQGPLNVDFLTKKIEQAFNAGGAGFSFSAGSTVLTWGGAGQPFIFEMKNVQVLRDDSTPVFAVDKVGVQLSKRYLIFGKVVPQVIRIYTPALRIVHSEDGNFSLNVNAAAAPAPAPAESPDAAPSPPLDQTALVKAILEQLAGSEGSSFLGHLRQVSIMDAAFLYDDKVLNVTWKSKESNLFFRHSRSGLEVEILANVDFDDSHTATVQGTVTYNWQTRKVKSTVSFVNVVPALIAQQSAALKDLAGIDVPLKGSASLTLDENLKPGAGRFSIEAGAGHVMVPGLYEEAMPVRSLYAQGRFNAATAEATLDNLQADLDGPKVSAHGSILKQDNGHRAVLSAVLESMPFDKLKAYWPPSLAPAPRKWVTGHLSVGVAPRATLEMALHLPHVCNDACAKPWDDFGAPTVETLGGEITFKGTKVDYYAPLTPVLKVDGRATYDQKAFDIEVTAGALGDMQVTGAKLAITDLDIQDEDTNSKIDIAAHLKGPLKTALGVLNKEPLQYPQKLGLQVDSAAGDAAVDVNFKFPLYEKLNIDDVNVTAKAHIENVALQGLVSDLPLTGGPLSLSLSEGALNVKGAALLSSMPVTFDWTKDFGAKAKVKSRVKASLPLDAAVLPSFGVPKDFNAAGTIPVDITYTVASDDTATLAFKGDVTAASFDVPAAGYTKPLQEPGTLAMDVHFKGDRLAGISGLSLTTEKAQMQGSLEMASDGQLLRRASFDRVRLGDTDVTFSLENQGSEGYNIKVSGPQLDASSFFKEDDDKPKAEAPAAPVTPMTIALTVDKLVTGKDKRIDGVRMLLQRNAWSRIERMDLDGAAGGRPLVLRYDPTVKGHTLKFQADNAGAALSALGIAKGVRGGRLTVNGQPNTRDPGKRNLYGTVILSDFSLVNVPVLGRLLNALSLGGFMELLNGKGIAFKKMRADFQWIDKGQPDTEKNTRLILLRDGQTSGASLGLTFEGSIDNWNNTLDMSGTIIPVSDLNKLVSSIPLVGNILTGGGSAVFAATYKIKGDTADPKVSVNPLSVLAPGILRKLFFEK